MLVGSQKLRQVLLSVRTHRTKLEHLEYPAVTADAGLGEDDRTAVKANESANEEQQRAQRQEGREAPEHVEHPLDGIGTANEPPPREAAKGDAKIQPEQAATALKSGEVAQEAWRNGVGIDRFHDCGSSGSAYAAVGSSAARPSRPSRPSM